MLATAKSPVLVTDGLWRKSLSAARSLGKAGYSVNVMGNSLFTTAFWSTFTQRRILAPLATEDAHEFGRILLKTLSQNPGTILLPMEDASLRWVVENSVQVKASQCSFLIPNLESLKVAQDKGLTMQRASQIGIPCPKTWTPDDQADWKKAIQQFPSGQYITKPCTGTGSTGFAVLNASTLPLIQNYWDRFGPMIIQETIPREGLAQGVSILMDRESRCVAAFAHQRLREYPVRGGPSTDRISILAPELVKLSIRLLKELNWRGIAMVEWKIDPRDHTPKLMEINPRFWGSLELAIRSGVDFPALYARVASGETISQITHYEVGRRCRWMIPGEFLRYFSQSKSQREPWIQFFRDIPGSAEEWDPQDPSGFIATLICTGALALHPSYWKYLRRG